jgi:hypothetical protein
MPFLAVYWLLLDVGVLLAPFIIAAYFVGEESTFRRPVEVGLALLVLGAATLAWWALRLRGGQEVAPRALVAIGRGALAIGVLLGAAKLAAEISAILASPAVH